MEFENTQQPMLWNEKLEEELRQIRNGNENRKGFAEDKLFVLSKRSLDNLRNFLIDERIIEKEDLKIPGSLNPFENINELSKIKFKDKDEENLDNILTSFAEIAYVGYNLSLEYEIAKDYTEKIRITPGADVYDLDKNFSNIIDMTDIYAKKFKDAVDIFEDKNLIEKIEPGLIVYLIENINYCIIGGYSQDKIKNERNFGVGLKRLSQSEYLNSKNPMDHRLLDSKELLNEMLKKFKHYIRKGKSSIIKRANEQSKNQGEYIRKKIESFIGEEKKEPSEGYI